MFLTYNESKENDKKENDKKDKSILVSSLYMSFAVFLSRILGLVRELVMAMVFGASHVTDIFLVAYRIPNLLRDLLAEGAFSAAFVPVFAEVCSKEKERMASRELLWELFFLLTLITGAIGILIIIFAPELTNLFAPSFAKNPERFNLSVDLIRLMAPYLFCVSIAALFMGVLNTLKFFFVPSLSPAAFNVVLIAFTILLPSYLISSGINAAYALGSGVLIGGIFQSLIQLPLLIKNGFAPLWPKKFFTANARRVLIRLGPGMIGFAATQINILVTTILASAIVGAVSWLNYAFRLFQFPLGIFGVAIANSHLVHFSIAYRNGDLKQARSYLSYSYYLTNAVMIPSMFLIFFLSSEITHIIFERGRFTAYDTMMTSYALKLFALGLPFYGINKILVPTFYAIDRQRIPVMITVFSVLVNVSFCFLLVPKYGFTILALGTTLTVVLSSVGSVIFLFNILQLKLDFFFDFKLLKFLLASAVVGFLTHKLAIKFFHFNSTIIGEVISLSLILLTAMICYALFMVILGEGEFILNFVSKIRNKISNKLVR
ncbi:MAG: murein biosynthesis integral membrane protein MurJ [Oligoflexia bacterium]|nr:murein biosynthesis integral membrane protein MurJ [Oligoflexia bacterium]